MRFLTTAHALIITVAIINRRYRGWICQADQKTPGPKPPVPGGRQQNRKANKEHMETLGCGFAILQNSHTTRTGKMIAIVISTAICRREVTGSGC
jgi:hypothetical protein